MHGFELFVDYIQGSLEVWVSKICWLSQMVETQRSLNKEWPIFAVILYNIAQVTNKNKGFCMVSLCSSYTIWANGGLNAASALRRYFTNFILLTRKLTSAVQQIHALRNLHFVYGKSRFFFAEISQ